MNNKIAIIIPYFGHWPDWVQLYFNSCARNVHIDWIFYTDCEIPETQYPNLCFHSLSFGDYCDVAGSVLNIQFKPSSPYKLCDLKPFYGLIHQKELSQYEFWGFGDVDVVWGDIDHFYSEELLAKYDIFSTHADRLSGHLALIKNNDHYRNLCLNIKNWQDKLISDKNYALDEIDYSRLLYPESKFVIKFYLKVIRKVFNWKDAWVIYYHIMPIINSILFLSARRLYFKEQHTTPILSDDGLTCRHDADEWYYKEGKITNNKTNQEYIYLHFMIYKKNNFRKSSYWSEDYYHIQDDYDYKKPVLINKEGFYPI